jgi:hypothetical protein
MAGINLNPEHNFAARFLALEATVKDLATRDLLQNASVGQGGLTVNGGGSIVITGGGSLTVSGSGTLNVASGGLSSAGSITAGTTVSAGTSLNSTGDTNVGGNLNLVGAGYFPQAYNNPVTTGTYYAAYLNGGDSRLGRTASSRRYKQDISTMPVSAQSVLALRIVQFRWKAEVEAGRDQGFDFGVIAEELHELGLTPWVFYNDEGQPEGVHYERMFLIALPLLQEMHAEIKSVKDRLDAAGL